MTGVCTEPEAESTEPEAESKRKRKLITTVLIAIITLTGVVGLVKPPNSKVI